MNIDFKEIPAANKGGKDQDLFESFACDFLESLGYEIIERPSRGPDGKKDLIVQSNSIPGRTNDSKVKWLVSCKHFAHSNKGVSDHHEPDISDRITKHKCHGFLGFYSTIANSTLSDKLISLRERYISTIYDHSRIEKEMHFLLDKERILGKYFPKSKEKWKFDKEKNSFSHFDINLSNTSDSLKISLLETIRTAQIQLEISKFKRQLNFYSADLVSELKVLYVYTDFANELIAKAIFDIANTISYGTRSGISEDIVHEIYSLILNFFPASNDNFQHEQKIENGIQCINIGYNIIYDAFIYLNDYKIAKWGLNILKFVYRESSRNNYSELINQVLKKYIELENTLNRPERTDLTNAKELVQCFKEDLDNSSLAFPPLPNHLYLLTSQL